MGIFKHKYLNDKHLRGFDNYKYVSIDTSPLSKYITNPIWDKTVEYIPKWLAPNLMTFGGFILTTINVLLLSYYDFGFYASTNLHPYKFPPIPNWVWLTCSINQFLSYALDCCDGKQARRTKTSTPLGELFDHGLDSWAAIFMPLCLYSVYGRAVSGLPPIRVYFIIWNVLLVFMIAHWEKYITGTFCLPWAYDASQIALSLLYLITFVFGYEFWHVVLHVGTRALTPGHIVEIIVYASTFAMTVPVALYHIYKAYHNNTGRNLSFFEAFRPLFPIFYLLVVSLLWITMSPNRIVDTEPRMFFIVLGTIYSNIVSKIVIAQMTGTRAKLFNFMLLIYTFVVAACLSTPRRRLTPNVEAYVLYALVSFVLVTHLHFGYNIVNQLCSYFGIYCFDITRKPNKIAKDD